MLNALNINNLIKNYDNNFCALDSINLCVDYGDFYAVLGPNGAGKSTTIGIISSLIYKTSGKVSICGHDIDIDHDKARESLGVVTQENNFPIFEKLLDALLDQAGFFGIPKNVAFQSAEKYLNLLQLWDKRNSTLNSLSGGMKKRYMIARALIHEPKLLILDEPTAGVDVEIRHLIWDFLRNLNKEGKTIILTTHYLEEAELLCDKIAIINKGKIIIDKTMKELLSSVSLDSYIVNIKNPDLFQTLCEPSKFHISMNDKKELEITIDNNTNLNIVLKYLIDVGYDILSIRNKSAKLEQLFLEMTR